MFSGIRTVVEKWDLTYQHSAGPTVSEFYRKLQEEGKIVGRRCPECSRVLVPPRSFCDRCFCDTQEWIEVANQGTIGTFTVVYKKFKQLPDPPYAIAYVILDGADTAILNYVQGVPLDNLDQSTTALQPGARVKVVFAASDQRQGKVTDFWFELE